MPGLQPVTLTADEAGFLAARLRRLFAHFGVPVPDGEDNARLIGNAGAGIGLLLTGRIVLPRGTAVVVNGGLESRLPHDTIVNVSDTAGVEGKTE